MSQNNQQRNSTCLNTFSNIFCSRKSRNVAKVQPQQTSPQNTTVLHKKLILPGKKDDQCHLDGVPEELQQIGLRSMRKYCTFQETGRKHRLNTDSLNDETMLKFYDESLEKIPQPQPEDNNNNLLKLEDQILKSNDRSIRKICEMINTKPIIKEVQNYEVSYIIEQELMKSQVNQLVDSLHMIKSQNQGKKSFNCAQNNLPTEQNLVQHYIQEEDEGLFSVDLDQASEFLAIQNNSQECKLKQDIDSSVISSLKSLEMDYGYGDIEFSSTVSKPGSGSNQKLKSNDNNFKKLGRIREKRETISIRVIEV